MKKVCSVLLVMILMVCSAAFAEEGKVETFSAEYEMAGTTSSGQPKMTPSFSREKPRMASSPSSTLISSATKEARMSIPRRTSWAI